MVLGEEGEDESCRAGGEDVEEAEGERAEDEGEEERGEEGGVGGGDE